MENHIDFYLLNLIITIHIDSQVYLLPLVGATDSLLVDTTI